MAENEDTLKLCAFSGSTNTTFYECFMMTHLNNAFPRISYNSWYLNLVICFYTTFCTTAGLILELIIFLYIMSPSETASSINSMIFVQHVLRTLMFASNFWTGMAFLVPVSLEEFFGPSFCPFFVALTGISHYGNIYWTAAIALTRYFYIRKGELMKKKMFKEFLFFVITILGQLVTLGAATIVVISDKQSFTYMSCTKQNIAIQEVIYYYQYKEKALTPFFFIEEPQKVYLAVVIVTITIISNGIEMFCNVSLFLEQIRATQKVSSILNQNAIKKRLRTNAINLIGQVFTWFVECVPLAIGFLVLVIDREEKGRELLALLKIFRFLLIPAVEIATSPPMKRFLSDYFN